MTTCTWVYMYTCIACNYCQQLCCVVRVDIHFKNCMTNSRQKRKLTISGMQLSTCVVAGTSYMYIVYIHMYMYVASYIHVHCIYVHTCMYSGLKSAQRKITVVRVYSLEN